MILSAKVLEKLPVKSETDALISENIPVPITLSPDIIPSYFTILNCSKLYQVVDIIRFSFFEILLIAVALDTILGVLRAIKEHKFNSCVGIDGAIRKVAMLLSVGLLMLTDIIMHINVLFMVPDKYIQLLGIQKMGVCEFFCLLFVLYEAVSILKNMTLCGLPVPERVREYIQKFLDDMTDELPKEEE